MDRSRDGRRRGAGHRPGRYAGSAGRHPPAARGRGDRGPRRRRSGAERPCRGRALAALAAAAQPRRHPVHLRLRRPPRGHLAVRRVRRPGAGLRPAARIQHRCRPSRPGPAGGADRQRPVDRRRDDLRVRPRLPLRADGAGAADRRAGRGRGLLRRPCARHPRHRSARRLLGRRRRAAGELAAPPRLRHQLRRDDLRGSPGRAAAGPAGPAAAGRRRLSGADGSVRLRRPAVRLGASALARPGGGELAAAAPLAHPSRRPRTAPRRPGPSRPAGRADVPSVPRGPAGPGAGPTAAPSTGRCG